MKISGKARLSRNRSRIRTYRASSANGRMKAPSAITVSAAPIHTGENTHHHDQWVTPASRSAMNTPRVRGNTSPRVAFTGTRVPGARS
jgi:hypothetical protein